MENLDFTKDQDISGRAMLVTINFKCWWNCVTDAVLGQELCEQHKATKDSAKVSRYLIDNKHLSALRSDVNALKSKCYYLSLPWGENNERILPTKSYFRFMEEFREGRRQFETSLKYFLENYPSFVEEARKNRGDFFDIADYPNNEEIAAKFALDVDVRPLPLSSDFRVSLDEDEKKKIEDSINKMTNDKLFQAQQALWSRVAGQLNYLSSRLKDADGVRYKSVLSSVAEIVDVMPQLNVANDPRVDQIAKEIKSSILDRVAPQSINGTAKQKEADPTILRKREQVAKQVDDIISRVSGIVQGDI